MKHLFFFALLLCVQYNVLAQGRVSPKPTQQPNPNIGIGVAPKPLDLQFFISDITYKETVINDLIIRATTFKCKVKNIGETAAILNTSSQLKIQTFGLLSSCLDPSTSDSSDVRLVSLERSEILPGETVEFFHTANHRWTSTSRKFRIELLYTGNELNLTNNTLCIDLH
jgi:hypothetical protein